MNALVTVTQGVAAGYANSLALLTDDVQMGVDTLTYGLNLYADKKLQEDPRIEVVSSLFSIVVLVVTSGGTYVPATHTALHTPRHRSPPDSIFP
jgi:Co/Zn/Cd efflux system component